MLNALLSCEEMADFWHFNCLFKKQSVDSVVILLFLKCLRLFCYLFIFDVDNTVDSVKY